MTHSFFLVRTALTALSLALLSAVPAVAQDKPATENDFYNITTLPIPKGKIYECQKFCQKC